MKNLLNEKIIVIIGGTTGLGLSSAKACVAAGAKVIVVGRSTESLEKARKKGGFTDIARHVHDEDQRLYSWWSYRARDWAASNKGRRLDHIWTTEAATALTDLDSYRVHLAWRGGWKPSDHAPISIEMDRP